MTWYDRDYARGPSPAPRPWRRALFGSGGTRPVAVTLIWINVAVFLADAFLAGPGHAYLRGPLSLWGSMWVEYVLHGQVWRLLTSQYLHGGTTHLFMNMLALYFLGPPLERVWGPRKFFIVYTLAGFLGSLFFMALVMKGWLASAPAVGASGCILGVLGAAAVLFPHAEVYVWMLFPMRLRTLAAILAGMYVLNLWQRGENAGGDACHLAGLVFGVWFALKGDRWWTNSASRLFSRFAPGRRDDPRRSPAHRERMAQRRSDTETIDRILAKVHARGIHSLSDAERRALADATARQRADDPDFL
ncbi:MAG: rhomboid family intramembrane serine protease [Phycisphaerales bacterium]|nr:rhomboid family intramembrane serine protease [Phycisphaerales bacterium]